MRVGITAVLSYYLSHSSDSYIWFKGLNRTMVVQVIVFLVDTSSSMNQLSYQGTSLLDIAKNAVESFIKIRNRDNSGRHDRYILVNFDERPYCIKSGWKENHATFSAELKNLRGNSLSTLGSSLRECFDFLNIPRLQSATDNYGMGRNPFYIEPACVILLTDGCSFTGLSGIESVLTLPNSGYEGAELTKEPFRWDQRLFSAVLRIPGITPSSQSIFNPIQGLDSHPEISTLCEATGGKSYIVTSSKSLTHCLESISSKIQTGVVVNFECLREPIRGNNRSERSSDSNTSDANYISSMMCNKKLVYVKANNKTGQFNGHWPIPEEFWPDANSNQLPPRSAHPTICIETKDSHPLLIENFPFDKYELEPSPLTQHILSKKSTHASSWQCYIMNSGAREGAPRAFGYLRASSAGKHVNLFVMPYDYPVIIPLLDELSKQNFRPTSQWTQEFNKYLHSIPPYYIQPLKNSLRAFGTPTLIPNTFDGNPSYNISAYLKKIKRQSEIESKKVYPSITQKDTNHLPNTQSKSFRSNIVRSKATSIDKLKKFRGLLHTPRPSIQQTNRLRDNSIPIAQMGNYQEYLSKVPPLREIDIGLSRTQLFANPYKLLDISTKSTIVDETDEDIEDRYGFKAPTDRKIKSKHKIKPPSPNTPPRSMTPPPFSQYEKQMLWIETRQKHPNSISSTDSHTTTPFSPIPELTITHTLSPHGIREDMESDQGEDHQDAYNSNHFAPIQSSSLVNETPSPSEQFISSRNESSSILLDSKNLLPNCVNIKRPRPTTFSNTQSKRHKTETMVCESLKFGLTKLKQLNNAKDNIRSEIRKSGKNYDNLFRILENLSEVEQKLILVQEAIDWATRFKKRNLIELLEDWRKRIYHN